MTAKADHVEMHGEHCQWLSDNGMWRDDLEAWRKETDQALQELKKLEEALREHRQRLEAQMGEILADEMVLKDHEHEVADLERKGLSDEPLGMANIHQEISARHRQQRLEHERFKKSHHQVMAYSLSCSRP